MKKIQNIILTAVLIAIASITHAQIKTQFTATTYAGVTEYLHLPNVAIEYHLTNDVLITFEMDVTTNTRKNKAFDFLVEEGRYDLAIEHTDKELYIKMPNLIKEITINKQQFYDEVTLKVYIPRGIKVSQSTPIIDLQDATSEVLAWEKTTNK